MVFDMQFKFSDRAKDIHARALEFARNEVAPAEKIFEEQVSEGDRWQPTAIVEELKKKARQKGLWNLFLPDSERGGGLTNLEYAPIAEVTGRRPEDFPEATLEQMIRLMRRELRAGKRIVYDEPEQLLALYARATCA